MYGYYLAAVMAAEMKGTPEVHFYWFSCSNCEVMWKNKDPKDHCFTCGRWGSREKKYTCP